jgi:predicted alpha/beta hydrolase
MTSDSTTKLARLSLDASLLQPLFREDEDSSLTLGMTATSEDIRIAAGDGYPLAATTYAPEQRARGVVVINSATAVRRRYYDRFAQYLASAGFGVITYDYRGIGGSAPRPLRGFVASMREWGEVDQPAVLAHAAEWQPGVPLFVVGHSVGGQIFGLLRDPSRVQRVLMVAAQHNYWGLWAPPRRWILWGLWHVFMPATSHLLGYFPSSKVGLGEDLPRGVALEWARWCRSPGALVQAIGGDAATRFAQYRGPILALSFDDDHAFAPRATVDALLRLYPSARVEHRHLTAASLGLKKVGHFGFFRETASEHGWRMALDWLAQT